MGCEYCENNRPLYEQNDNRLIQCSLMVCKEVTRGPKKLRLFMDATDYTEDVYLGIRYCPMCGKKLKKRTQWCE